MIRTHISLVALTVVAGLYAGSRKAALVAVVLLSLVRLPTLLGVASV